MTSNLTQRQIDRLDDYVVMTSNAVMDTQSEIP